jgi:predicted small lipoprotein YifL
VRALAFSLAFVSLFGCGPAAEGPVKVPDAQPAHADQIKEAPPKPNMAVTPDTFRRLRSGMSELEIETILDGPGTEMTMIGDGYRRTWHGDGCTINIGFMPRINQIPKASVKENCIATSGVLWIGNEVHERLRE